METSDHSKNSVSPDAVSPSSKEALASKAGHSRTFKYLVFSLAELIILLGVFSLGLNVGFRKAGYTYSWVANYPGNFGAPATPAAPQSGQFFNAHGVYGEILSNNGGGLIIKDSDGNEKTVMLAPGATIRQNYQTIQLQNLKPSEEIVVIGEPNDQGQIQAKFIRILDQN